MVYIMSGECDEQMKLKLKQQATTNTPTSYHMQRFMNHSQQLALFNKENKNDEKLNTRVFIECN